MLDRKLIKPKEKKNPKKPNFKKQKPGIEKWE